MSSNAMRKNLAGSPDARTPLAGLAVPTGFGGVVQPFWSFFSKYHAVPIYQELR